VPVDSRNERRAFGTLRATLKILRQDFPEAEFCLEKPVFDIKTPEGPCLPGFVIPARRGDDILQGKEVTHPRMETLGTLSMQRKEFGSSSDGVKAEGREVDAADPAGAREALVRRPRVEWGGVMWQGSKC